VSARRVSTCGSCEHDDRHRDDARRAGAGDGTRLVTRYAGAVERYRQGGGSLGELLAEMDLLTAQHIRAVDDQPESPGEALALAGGERMNPTRPDISWDD
jgi:hypothetical protein